LSLQPIPFEDFDKPISESYRFLPFQFSRRRNGDYLLSNMAGELLVLKQEKFNLFTNKKLKRNEHSYLDLKAKHFLVDGTSSANMGALAAKYNTKKSFLDGFTKLHIFVTSLRCNQSCQYCQVSRKNEGDAANHYDMSEEVLSRSVELMLSSPAPHITMEFQGGDPLVNFDLVKEGVRFAKDLNRKTGKIIDYVLCTNGNTPIFRGPHK
jgi:uncharacterized protein